MTGWDAEKNKRKKMGTNQSGEASISVVVRLNESTLSLTAKRSLFVRDWHIDRIINPTLFKILHI